MKAVAMSCKTAAHTFRATRNESDPFPIVELAPPTVAREAVIRAEGRLRADVAFFREFQTCVGTSSTEESDYDISLNADDMGEDSSVFRRTQRLLNLETDFAFETDFGSGFVSDMGICRLSDCCSLCGLPFWHSLT
jgi:hypothetical protein